MAYSLQLPNGTYVDGIPDSIPQAQALASLKQKYPQAFGQPFAWDTSPLALPEAAPAATPKRGGIMGSLAKGTEGLLSASQTGVEAVLGDPAKAAQAGMQRQQAMGEKYAQEVGLQKIAETYRSEGLGAAAKEVMRQFPHVLAEQAPNIALTIAGAKAGAITGAAVTGGNPVGAAVGAVVGGAGALMPQYIGANVERQAEQQKAAGEAVNPSVGTAALAGAGQAALDYASLRMLGGNMVAKWMSLPTKTAEQELARAAARSLKGSAGVGAAKGLVEIPTEMAQQVIERMQAGMPLLSDDALAEYGEAAYMAGMVGPSLGSVSGVVDRSSAKSQLAEKKRQEEIAAHEQKVAAEKARLQSPEYLNSPEGLATQREAAGKRIRELRGLIKRAQHEDEKAPLEEEHRALTAKVKDLTGRIAEAKKSPMTAFLERAAEESQRAPVQRGAPAADTGGVPIAPGVYMTQEEQLASEKAAAKQRGEDWVDPTAFAAHYDTADATDAYLMSLTDPAEYAKWQQRTAKQEALDSFGEIAPPPPVRSTTGPAERLYAQQDQLWQDNLAQQMGDVREQSLARVQAEQEGDALERAASAMEQWTDQRMQSRMEHPGTRPRYLEGRRDEALAHFLKLPPQDIETLPDADILAAIARRQDELRSEQQHAARLPITNRQVDAQGNVTGVGIRSKARLNELARIDMEMADLERLRRLYSNSQQKPDSLAAGMLATEAERAFRPPQEQRPQPTSPTIAPSEIKPRSPIAATSVQPSLIGQSQSRILPPQPLDEKAERRERARRAQALGDRRDAAVNEFIDVARQIHEGEFLGQAAIERDAYGNVKSKRPRNVNVDPSSAASLLGALKKKAAGLIRAATELSVAQAAEQHAAQGGALPRTQAQVYAGRIADTMRDYLDRVEANVSPARNAPNPTTAESPAFAKRAFRNATPFGDIVKAEGDLVLKIEELVKGMTTDNVGQFMSGAAGKPQRTRSPTGKEIGLTRPTAEGLAREEGVARGTNRQQHLDYVYERVRGALQEQATPVTDEVYPRATNVGQVLPPPVRSALEASERALREEFEGVIQGDIYADRQHSKVTPALLQDIETLLDTKDPQDAARVMEGLRQVADVNIDDTTQGELFADQADQPQVRLVKRSPFHLRQFINSKHVQQLRELVKPASEWTAFLEKQLEALRQKFEASKTALVYDAATDGGYSRVQQFLDNWNQTTNNMRMLAARMSAANEDAKQQNYDAIERSIQGIYRQYEALLRDVTAHINGDPLGETTSYKDILSILEAEYARLDEAARLAVGRKIEAGEAYQADAVRTRMAGFNAKRAATLPFERTTPMGTTLRGREALPANVEAARAQAQRVREKEAERIVAEMKAKARAAAKAQEEARQRFAAATKTSVKQEKVVTEYPRQIPGSHQYVADRVIETKRERNDSPLAPSPLADRWQAELDAAAAEGNALGEAQYAEREAQHPAQRVKLDQWRTGIARVQAAITALKQLEARLDVLVRTPVNPAEQAAEPPAGEKRNTKVRPAPAQITTAQPLEPGFRRQVLEKQITDAEVRVLQEWDALQVVASEIGKTLEDAGIDKAMGVAKAPNAATKVERVAGITNQRGGARRRTSPMNATAASFAAVRRAELERNKHPAELPATRPGERGPTTPATSSSAPYTKDIGAQLSSQEELRARLRAKFAKKGKGAAPAAEPPRETILRSQQAETPDAALEAAAATQYPQRQRSASTGFGQKLADAVGDIPLKNAVVRSTVTKAATEAAEAMGVRAPVTDGVLDAAIPMQVAQALPTSGATENGNLRLHMALDAFIQHGPQELRPLARLIKALLPKNPDAFTLLIDAPSEGRPTLGSVGVRNGKPFVQYNPSVGGAGYINNGVFLHELLHAAILTRLVSVSRAIKGETPIDSPELQAAVDRFKGLYQEFQEGMSVMGRNVGPVRAALNRLIMEEGDQRSIDEMMGAVAEALKDPEEFLTYALTDPAFQRVLAAVEYKGKSLMQRFKDWVKSLFGFDTKAPSWLDAATLASMDLLQASEAAPLRMPRAAATRNAVARTVTDIDRIAQKLYQEPPGRWDVLTKNYGSLVGRTQFVDRFAPVAAMAKEMADTVKATQMVYFARAADRVNQFVAENLTHGPVRLRENVRADGKKEHLFQSVKGMNLRQILDTLRGENFNTWASYLALERAQKANVGIEKLMGEDTPRITPEEQARILEYGRNNAAFQRAREQYRAYNDELAGLAEETGLVTPDEAARMREGDYIPFYRLDPNGNIVMMGEHPIKIGNVRDQKDLAHLFGSDKALDDPFANIARNSRIIIGTAIRNQMARNTAFTMNELGLGKLRRLGRQKHLPQGRNVVQFKYQGVDHAFEIETEANPRYAHIPGDVLAKGMEGIATTLPAGLRMLAFPAKVLRMMVTRNPLYVVRQLIRDPMHAWLSTGMDAGSITKGLRRMSNLLQHKDATGQLLRERGLIGGQVIQGTDEDMGRIMAQLHSGQNVLSRLFARLDDMAVAADATTRAGLYEGFKKRGLSDMEATLATMDSVNFATRGASPSMQWLNMVIPFFNAQVQGLDSVWRAMSGQMPHNELMKARQKLAERALMMVGSSLLYYAMVQDEEWYKNTPETVRLSNWLLPPIPGLTNEPIKIPIPFEFGLLFKALPEAMALSSNTDSEARAAMAALKNLAINSIPGGSSMGMPAAVKPLFEAMSNYSTFSGRDIVPQHLQDEDGLNQYLPHTLEIAKDVSALTGGFVSPIHVEHLVRGYTAGLGFAALQLLDAAFFATNVPKPEGRMSEKMLVGPLFQRTDSTAIVNRAYENVNRINSAAGRFKKAMEVEQDLDKATRIMQEDGDLIRMKSIAGRFRQQMGELSKMENQIRFHPTMPPAEKTERLTLLRQRKIALAQQMEQRTPQ